MMSFKLDTSKFDAALRQFMRTSRKSGHQVLMDQARLFVRDAVSVTPPNTGKTAGGKQRGEAAITGDLFGGRSVNMGGFRVKTRGFFEITAKGIVRDEIVSLFTTKSGKTYGVEKRLHRPNASPAEMLAHRAQYRSKETGKMSTAGLRTRDVGRHVFIDRMVVAPAAAKAMLRELYKRVGFLAGGWNAAAQKLKAKVPGWISKHGTRFGGVTITLSSSGMSIKMENSVSFVGSVRGFSRRVQWALNNRAKAMEKRLADYAIKQAAKKAGFR